MEKINWLNSFEMKKIKDETLIELLEMVVQATKKKRKDNVEWFCFPYLELVEVAKGRMMKQVVKIGIGPILSNVVPLIREKIEIRCDVEIQSCDFNVGIGSEIFFVARIESATDIFSRDSVIRRKLSERGGKKEIKEEIERAVEKLNNAFKKFNDMIDAMMVM